MRVVSVSGARNSGKTTRIRRLVGHFRTGSKQAAVIVNEEGQAAFDDAFIQAHNLSVKYIRGG